MRTCKLNKENLKLLEENIEERLRARNNQSQKLRIGSQNSNLRMSAVAQIHNKNFLSTQTL